MKNITIPQSKEFVKGVCKGLIELGAKKVKGMIHTRKSFELETNVGKLYISVEIDNVHCFTVFSRFYDVERAKKKYNCNPFSGKYNFHRSKSELFSMEQMIEFALMQFEGLTD